VPLNAIRVLNVGTTDEVANHPKRLDNGGLATWARPAAQLVLTASSRGAQGIAEHLAGRECYSRFDAQVSPGLYRLDDADPEDLAGLAAGQSRKLSPIFTARFAGHTARPYQPLPPPSNTTEYVS
jgi:hypothetical protein